MTDRTIRAIALGFLASTALASPAFAQAPADATPETESTQSPAPGTNATNVTGETPAEQVARDGRVPDESEIIITATKREENLQDVPISVQAIGTRRLDQLNISNFEDYTKQLPSVSFQTAAPGFTTVYMRGVASGGDGNHTGSLPSVGFYLDEQPVTTIGGTLDVHIYDIARIESLAGPQGTLYGASSQAGTIRIITNKPELGVTTGRIDGELNSVAHGGVGGSLEGMINLPIADNIAFRASAFYKRDAGYIDNVFGERTYCGTTIFGPNPLDPTEEIAVGCIRDGIQVDNAEFVKDNFNTNKTYGGRAALKIDLDENWTVTPTILHQQSKTKGVFYMDADLDDLETQRFREEPGKDKFTQYALTVEGKIGSFDITYAGAYMHRPNSGVSDYTEYADAYDAYYESNNDDRPGGGLAYYFYFQDDAGNTIDPRQYIVGGNNFKKLSQELRIASPQDNPLRFIGGLFYQRQSNDILQEYRVDNLAADLSVNGLPGMLWLTKQERIDRDYAVFGELSYDITPQITLTGGGRRYKFDNTVFGFAGFGRNPDYFQDAEDNPPPNAAGSSRTGVAQCFTVSGLSVRDAQLAGLDDTLITEGALSGTPCINVADLVDGEIVPKRAKDTGWTYRVNGTWKPRESLMFYATRSTGYRPGGINRQPGLDPYDADFLINNEVGWKTTVGPVRWNGAVYHQKWKEFQFSFLGENSLTVVQNGRDAKINGIETDVNYVNGGLTLNAAAAYTDAKLKENICDLASDPTPNCDLIIVPDDPETPDVDETERDFIIAPKGTRLPVTPKFKFSTTARYTWDMGPGRAHGQIGLVHQGKARASLGTAEQAVTGNLPAYTLVDLFAGYNWSRYSVELFATNVFDKRNQLSRFFVCGGNCETNEFLHIVPGRPRMIGIRGGAKF